jgi:tubulin--tyrosine ligase-like protein 12
MFWIRIGNKSYTLSDFDDYEKHFTVMNYNADYQMKQLLYTDFIRNFNDKESVKWDAVQGKIDFAMKSALHAAAVSPAPLGMKSPITVSNPNRFFAIYGVDVMVSSAATGYTPKILEINFNPDCTRACQYDKYFSENILGQVMVDLGKCSTEDFSGAEAWRAM